MYTEDNYQYKQFIDNPFIFKAESRSCLRGEAFTESGECDPCNYGYYLLKAPTRITPCNICDKNAICFGEDQMAPQAKHYRTSTSSDEFMECKRTQSCLEGDENNTMGICAEGYYGLMCGQCQDGYKSLEMMECEKCPAWGRVVINTLVRVFNIVLLIFLLANNNFSNVQ